MRPAVASAPVAGRATWAPATAVVPRASDEAAIARGRAVPQVLSPHPIVGAAPARHPDPVTRRVSQAHGAYRWPYDRAQAGTSEQCVARLEQRDCLYPDEQSGRRGSLVLRALV